MKGHVMPNYANFALYSIGELIRKDSTLIERMQDLQLNIMKDIIRTHALQYTAVNKTGSFTRSNG